MKPKEELEIELRHREGILKGLRAGGRAPQDKMIEAKAWVNALRWVLAESTGGESKS